MRLIAMMLCRNEDWILDVSARAALMWCDGIAIMNHFSQDESPAIIDKLVKDYPGRVQFDLALHPVWDEMAHRQRILELARHMEASHVAIVDADEILTSNLIGTIRHHVGALPRGWIMQLPGYNLRGGLDRYHSTGIWSERWFSVAFRDDHRLSWWGDHFHQREPGGAELRQSHPVKQGQGGIMHLWGANERRLTAKHALYKMTEVLRWPNKSRAQIDATYSQALRPSANMQFDQDWRYAPVPPGWWSAYDKLRPRIQLHATPWQEQACRDLWKLYGAEHFAGLDLFGVTDQIPART